MNYRTYFLVIFSLFFISQLQAQESNLSTEASTYDEPHTFLGDNFAFGYGDDLILNFNHLRLDEDFFRFSALHLSKGLTDNFGLTIGTLLTGDANPQIFYLTPEFNFKLSENWNLGLQLKTLFPDRFDDVAFNPSAQLSYGSASKNITFGYAFVFNDENIEWAGFGDLYYSGAELKLAGRLPLTNEIGLISQNTYAPGDFDLFASKLGLDYRKDKFNVYLLASLIDSFSSENSDGIWGLTTGASFRF